MFQIVFVNDGQKLGSARNVWKTFQNKDEAIAAYPEAIENAKKRPGVVGVAIDEMIANSENGTRFKQYEWTTI